MADSPSFWSDWVNDVTTVPKSPAPTSFSQRFGFPDATKEPDVDISRTGGDPYKALATFANAQALEPADAIKPITGPQIPQRMASAPQQPNIPIQSPQGAPQTPTQSMQMAPNSGVVGQSPYSNQALTGGDGSPIGGLPTQQPMAPLSGPQQPRLNPVHYQNFQKLMASLPANIRPYIFGMNS